MSSPLDDPKLDSCGCCGDDPLRPAVRNRPGLPALQYRIGKHGDIFRRLVAALPFEQVPSGARPLGALTTRALDDPSIALFDAWAAVEDVLSFYQERIANEGFLRTATERRSILWLAREIGYELKPGVAASAFLAFSVIDAPGSPRSAVIPIGTKIQSVPAQGKLPQVFETVEEIQARVEWNVVQPQLYQPQLIHSDTSTVYLKGTALNLKTGDLMLVVVDESGIKPVPRRVSQVLVEAALQRTRVTFEGPQKPIAPAPQLQITKLAVPVLQTIAFNEVNLQVAVASRQWRERDLSAMISIQRWPYHELPRVVTPPAPPLPKPSTGVFAMRVRDGIFGHNAPNHGATPPPANLRTDPFATDWDDDTKSDIWRDPAGTGQWGSADLFLERAESGVTVDSWIVLERPTNIFVSFRVGAVSQQSIARFGISGKATGLNLDNPDGTSPISKDTAFKIRTTSVYAQSENLALAMLPIEDPVAAGSTQLTLNGMVLGLQEGQHVALGGQVADTPGVTRQEVLTLTDIIHSGGYTTIFFKEALGFTYIRNTVTMSANIARSTHGETIAREVLGSGNGALVNQKFELKRPPLTYVSAQTASGAESTLSVRVNGLEWEETSSLYPLDPGAEKYIVRIDDQGAANIIFGDGQKGRRLSAGVENIIAAYRTGIGLDGNVPAGSLTLLQNTPLGVRGVTNPLPASGAADPELLDDARANAPRTVLTLDRIVSLSDYENFARAFAGIGKSRAIVLRKGEQSPVHITVAGVDGADIPESSDLYTNLLKAIALAHDSTAIVDVRSFVRRYFHVTAAVIVDKPKYVVQTVLDAVSAALLAAFSFENRSFGQGVSTADIIAVIQSVPGVVASDLTQLYAADDPDGAQQTTAPAYLPADAASWSGADIVPAQLLLINPAGVTISEMKA